MTTSTEPPRLTLEEALTQIGHQGLVLMYDGLFDEQPWVVDKPEDTNWDAPKGRGATIPTALESALERKVVARDDTAELVEADPCQELRDAVDNLKARIHEIAVAGLASSPKAVVVQAMARDLRRLVGMEES